MNREPFQHLPRFPAKTSRGVAVVTVLVLITVLTVLALSGSRVALGRRQQAAWHLERTAARHAAHSGLAVAAGLLSRDTTPWDGPGDPWFEPVHFRQGALSVTLVIEDEQSKICVPHLVRPSGEPNEPLIEILDRCLPGPAFDAVAWQDTLTRWRTVFEGRRLTGEAVLKLLSLQNMTGPVEGDPQAREKGLPVQSGHDSVRFTVYGNGRINLNTAPAVVLDAMGGPDFRRRVIQMRTEKPLESIFDAVQSADLPPGRIAVADVRSSYYRITVRAAGQFVTMHLETVVWRQSGHLSILSQREWGS